MANIAEIKRIANPIQLAEIHLGEPVSRRNGKLWYKSPFRSEERTASFCVSEKGFYDFGISQYYDVIEFIKNIKHCDFKTAIKYLENYYGIKSNEYETNEVRRILKQQQEYNNRYMSMVKEWYIDVYGLLCKCWQRACEYKSIFEGKIDLDVYAIILNLKTELEGFIEVFQNATTFKEKERLYQERGELMKWLRKK